MSLEQCQRTGHGLPARLATLAVIVAASADPVVALAAEPQPDKFRAAAFTDAPRSLQNRIRFPKVEGDVRVRLDCDAWISRKGAVLGTYCLAPDNRFMEYERAVAVAARNAVIAPALVDGAARDVWFQYRVEFVRSASIETIKAFPNQGLQAGTYGPEYSGPQRLEVLSERLFSRDCPSRMRLWVVATVSEGGTPEGVSVETNGVGNSPCRTFLLDRFQRARFVPAFVGGQPARAQYREIFVMDAGSRRLSR